MHIITEVILHLNTGQIGIFPCRNSILPNKSFIHLYWEHRISIFRVIRLGLGPRRVKKRGAHPARGPKWDREILKQCMRHKPHTNRRHPLRTRSPCYEGPPRPTLPRHEGECPVKVSMRCSYVSAQSFIPARARTDQAGVFGR